MYELIIRRQKGLLVIFSKDLFYLCEIRRENGDRRTKYGNGKSNVYNL